MEIQLIKKKEALDFFAKYEHLGNCGLGVWHYGMFNEGQLMSVVSFGSTSFNPQRSSIAMIASKYKVKIIQLTRGGTRFDAPKNTASKAVSLAIKEIKKRFGNTIIVAYSDTRWNEIGTIYQATNFLYMGQTVPKGQANYVINGHKMSGWTVRKKYHTRSMEELKKIDEHVQRILLTPKHMYLYINTSKHIKQKIFSELQTLTMTYPKRSDFDIGSMMDIWKSKELIR